MKKRKITSLEYRYGDEECIKNILYSAKEPILIKIKGLTEEFTLDYFIQNIKAQTTYCTYKNNKAIAHQAGDFSTVVFDIKNNKPYRIFGQILYRNQSKEIEKHVPLWQSIPFRPRYFNPLIKVAYFFGGQHTNTNIHFDREHCSNLHLCLYGKKELLLFTEDQSDTIYKTPFISDSLIDFSRPINELIQTFPRLKKAECYQVVLEHGDMLFMPKNCWHYTQYHAPSAAATYVFYPKKRDQIYGYFTGYFFLGYSEALGFGISNWRVFKNFSRRYALATGYKKMLYKLAESFLFFFMLPVISVLAIISYKLKPRRVF